MILTFFNGTILITLIILLLFIFSYFITIDSDQKLKILDLLSYFLITCCGGVFGVTMRSLNNLAKGLFADWSISIVNLARGLGVGFMVGVLYFAGELTITGNIGSPVDQPMFLRTGCLVGICSILSGLYLEGTFTFLGFSFNRKFAAKKVDLKDN